MILNAVFLDGKCFPARERWRTFLAEVVPSLLAFPPSLLNFLCLQLAFILFFLSATNSDNTLRITNGRHR